MDGRAFPSSEFRNTIRRCGDPPLRSQAWIGDATILHAVANAVTIVDLEPDADPPKVLAVGPDPAGNLLEVVWIDLEGGAELVIHAMRLRPAFYALLPKPEEDQA